MLMNGWEKALVNNSFRAGLQRFFEMPLLLKMGGRLQGGTALEVGCGRGIGTELILKMSGFVSACVLNCPQACTLFI